MNNKALVFDTGPIISLTMNNLLWLIEPLKERFKGEFYITPKVYNELIEKPLETKKYKFEALQILPYINEGTIKVIENPAIKETAERMLNLINTTFKAQGNWIKVVHYGEIESVAAALFLGSKTVVIDERTCRDIIEEPMNVAKYMERKFHTKIYVEKNNIENIKKDFKELRVIRSAELAVVAYDIGLLKRYMSKDKGELIKDARKAVLEGVLWGIKLNGCSIKREEIYKVIDAET